MEMDKSRRLKSIIFVLILISLLVGFSVFLKLYYFASRPVRIHSEESLAQALDLRPEVSFRNKNELLWSDLRSGDFIYLGDLVHTRKDAFLKLRFKNGSEVEINQEALLSFDLDFASNHGFEVDSAILKWGELSITSSKTLVVYSPSSVARFSAGPRGFKGNLQISQDKKLKLTVAAGSSVIAVRNRDGTINRFETAENNATEVSLPSLETEVTKKELELYDELLKSPISMTPSPTLVPSTPIPTPPKKQPEPVKKSKIIPAAVNISFPPNGTTIYEESINLRGNVTKPKLQLFINKDKISINPNLSFSTKLKLRKGSNLLVIHLIDTNGRSTFTQWKVIRGSK